MFTWESEVKDSELDIQGVVNNANYLVYMEHARHKHLKSLGIDFTKMHDEGFDLVLAHVEIDFKAPLKGGDRFIVTSKLEKIGKIRFVFWQQVIRKKDEKIMVEAKNVGACIDVKTRRPVMPEELEKLF